MSTFADSSALVKFYADEPDHGVIRSLSAVIIAELARVEVPAAIWRKYRLGELDSEDAAVLVAEFERAEFEAFVACRPRRLGLLNGAIGQGLIGLSFRPLDLTRLVLRLLMDSV